MSKNLGRGHSTRSTHDGQSQGSRSTVEAQHRAAAASADAALLAAQQQEHHHRRQVVAATVAHHQAAALYRQEAATRVANINDAARMGSLNAGNWLSAGAAAQHAQHAQHAAAIVRHQHQHQTNAVAAHAQVKAAIAAANAVAEAASTAPKLPEAAAKTLKTTPTIPPAASGSAGVIPIGFFRDPQGNAWAASLQHPSHSATPAPLSTNARDRKSTRLNSSHVD